MKRFGAKESGKVRSIFGFIGCSFLSLAMIAAVVIGSARVQASSSEQQLSMLRDSVMKAAVHCYAVKGAYPTDVKQLEDEFGLVYDHDKYIVDYRCFASNMMPEITVLEK